MIVAAPRIRVVLTRKMRGVRNRGKVMGLAPNAANIPFERSPIEGSKTRGSQAHASPKVKHDETVGEGADRENDFPRIIRSEATAPHSVLYDFRQPGGGGGASG